jgi:predicted small secreted protein
MRHVVVMVLALVLLTACNTMHGLGRDVERTGEWVQKKADRARE